MSYVLGKCSATLFAYDSTIYFTSSNTSELRNTLQSDLQLLLDWVRSNKLFVNAAKTKTISFRARSCQLCQSLKDLDVEQVQEASLLSVTLNEQPSWEKHIENVVKKMARGISNINSSE